MRLTWRYSIHTVICYSTFVIYLQSVDGAVDYYKRKTEYLTKQMEKLQPLLSEKYRMKQGKGHRQRPTIMGSLPIILSIILNELALDPWDRITRGITQRPKAKCYTAPGPTHENCWKGTHWGGLCVYFLVPWCKINEIQHSIQPWNTATLHSMRAVNTAILAFRAL